MITSSDSLFINQKNWVSFVRVEKFLHIFYVSVKNDCLSELYLLQLKTRSLSSSTSPNEHTLQICLIKIRNEIL